MPSPIENGHYTYEDYYSWDDGKRYELIAGVPYHMTPSPSTVHQLTSGELLLQFANFLKGKSAKVFVAPLDVRLNADGADDTVVQPDLLVVCDPSKLMDERCCVGAPDLTVEILSPSTAQRDQTMKLELYQSAGVHEYWMVDPDAKTVDACILDNGRYRINRYSAADTVPVQVLDGCVIDLREVFAD